jgi:hypothetical protein
MSAIPALRRQRQEYQEFKANLGFITRPYLKKIFKEKRLGDCGE